PEQRRDVSYGTSPDGLQTRYFKSPSPGAENLIGFTGFVAEPTVSIGRGFYEEPITITLLSETEGALFLYTLDGSAPSIGAPNARTYSNPITIDTTATLRAIA